MLRAKQPCDANADNLFVRFRSQSGCCPSADTECQYSFTVPDASTVTGITVIDCDGVSQALLLPAGLLASSVGALAIARALDDLIKSAGYASDPGGGSDFTYYETGTSNIIIFYGEAVISSVQQSAGGDIAVTAACTAAGSRCQYYLSWAGSTTPNFIVSGPDGSRTLTVLATLTPAANTAADVDTALTALVPASADVVVFENATPTPDVFEIYILAPNGYTFELGVTASEFTFAKSQCHPHFTT